MNTLQKKHVVLVDTHLIVQTVEEIVAQQTIYQNCLALKIFSESACT